MTRYFAQNTPRAGLEHMMMSVPGFQKRGGGMMILSRFCYKPEDVDCRYCLHYLAALYLLASKERLWQPALPALSHDSIDFSRIVSKPHGFAIQDYPIFYSARRLYDLKSPMEAEDLAHPKLVSDLDFHNIIYATMIARYGKAVMDASKEAPEWAMC